MIIWSGLGFLVPVTVFGCALAANLISNEMLGEGYWDAHKWPCGISLIFSGVFCWFFGVSLRQRTDRTVVDKETGEELVINQSHHSLFFIPMHYWGPILLAAAAVVLAREITG